MRTIGYRKRGLIFLYAFTSLIGAIWAAFVVIYIPEAMIVSIGGILCMIVSILMLVGLLKTPYEAIILKENVMKLILPQGVIINIADITDIWCVRATSKYGRYAKDGRYKWGMITIRTKQGKGYKVRFIADCQDVVEQIERLKDK